MCTNPDVFHNGYYPTWQNNTSTYFFDSMAEGVRFEVHLTKARGIVGDDAKPFEVNLVTEGKSLQWHIKELEDVEMDELKRLLGEGFSIRDCADEMGKSKSAIHRLKRRLEG